MTFEEILKEPLPSKMIDNELYVCESPNSDLTFPGKPGNCKISMRSNEGKNIPHFHIESKSKNVHVAVCLHESKYFKHDIWKDELNEAQKRKLQEYLLKVDNLGDTNWEKFSRYWNDSPEGSKNKVNIDKMPDYTKMTESITDKKGKKK